MNTMERVYNLVGGHNEHSRKGSYWYQDTTGDFSIEIIKNNRGTFDVKWLEDTTVCEFKYNNTAYEIMQYIKEEAKEVKLQGLCCTLEEIKQLMRVFKTFSNQEKKKQNQIDSNSE